MSKVDLPDEDACLRMRRTCPHFILKKAERLVGDLLNERLAPANLTVSQLPVLAALRMYGAQPLSKLAAAVSVDVSTLSRNLSPLVKRKFVAVTIGGPREGVVENKSTRNADIPTTDRRVRMVSLTSEGEQALAIAYPAWEQGVRELAAAFDAPPDTRELMPMMDGENAKWIETLANVRTIAAAARKQRKSTD